MELFHGHLKDELRARYNPGRWVENLRLVLLGYRTAVKSDLRCDAADLSRPPRFSQQSTKLAS